MFHVTTDNTGDLTSAESHDYMIKQFCAYQPLGLILFRSCYILLAHFNCQKHE
jgi:hypothetical protein